MRRGAELRPPARDQVTLPSTIGAADWHPTGAPIDRSTLNAGLRHSQSTQFVTRHRRYLRGCAHIAQQIRRPGSGELGGGLVAERAVRSALVVVGAPSADDPACFGERAEPVFVQALVPALAIEALGAL